MASAKTITYVTINTQIFLSLVLLSTTVTIIFYQTYPKNPFSLSRFGNQHCNWTKRKTKGWQNTETEPWFHLLADYNATIRSDKNLYVWPAAASGLRLGNKLFNYAATFGIAWLNRRIPIWPRNRRSGQHDITRFFSLRIPFHKDRIIQNSVTRTLPMREVGSGIYDKRFEHLPARNISIISIFASFKYFQHVEEQLRFDFTFKPYIMDIAQRWLEQQTPDKWKDKQFVRVVIHVRRTDFVNPAHERDGWPTPTAEYFRRSMSYFTDCLERVQFVVISDDPYWCSKHINGTNVVYSSGHSPIVDMAIASLCNHAIITIGTYGWWAAWFANGVTITQKNLPRNGSSLSKRLYRADHYKPNWIGL